MAWQTPKTNWQAADVVSKDDFNRIEGNVQELQNTKETPAGAQAKADAAESAAKSYADGVAAGEAGAVQAELAAHKADYVLQTGYATATGSANAYAVTLDPAPVSLVDGLCVAVKINVTNTGASTINVNSKGAKAIKKSNGNDVSSGDLKVGSIYTLRYNGINFILQGEGGGYDDFFGDGSDGALNTSGNVTFPVTAHTGLIVKQYSSITINAGHIVTVNSPCRGLVLYSQGNVTINGTIDMSKKAGFSVGEIPPILITKSKLDKYNRLATIFTSLKGGAGGKGGYGGGGKATSYRSPGGLGGGGRLFAGGYGGGGGGGCYRNDYQSQQNGGNGGTVDYNDLGGGKSSGVWSHGRDDQSISLQGNNGIHGGGGSGGAYAIPRRTSSYSRTGDGGICFGGGGGGSGGCSVYDGNSSDAGNGEFAGGFILIVSGGNINIGSTGKLLANGGNGGDGSAGAGEDSSSCWGDGGGGGGGGGGGVVALFYKQSYTNSGSISVSGGLGGSGGASGKVGGDSGGSGTSGSIGTVYTEKLV